MLVKKTESELVVELRGHPDDFGLASEFNTGEVLTTKTLVSRFDIIPGTRAAREYWEAVESHALEEESYSHLSTDFGEGGLSALVFDKMVVYYGMNKGTANLITKIYFLTKGGIKW